MNKNYDLIITLTVFFIALIMPGQFLGGIWMFGSASYFILPGYWILRFFKGVQIENKIIHVLLSLPVSIAYMSLASLAANRFGMDITYFSLVLVSALPCLAWVSRMGRSVS